MKFKNLDEKLDCFSNLYYEYKDQVYRSIHYYTNQANYTEDIVQDTFIIVSQKLDQLRNISKAKSWIHIIAYNVAKKYLRKYSNSKIELLDEFSDDIEVVSRQQQQTLEEEVLLHEDIASVFNALDQLKTVDRQLVLMKYQQNLSYNEMGKILNAKPQRLKWRMPSILNKVRTIMYNER